MPSDPSLIHHNVNHSDSAEDCNHGKNPPLHKAIVRRNDSEIESLLSLSSTDIEAVDNYGNTPLMGALLSSFHSAVDLLLRRDVNVNAKNYTGETPLHFAVLEGNEIHITVLIEKGANINSKNRKRKTPLSKAVEINSELAMKVLIAKSCNVNVLDKNRNSPLHIALNRKLWKVAEILVKSGSNLTQQNKGGETPLHIGCHKGILLGNFYSTNVPVIKDVFPFTEASARELVSICKLLLGNDADENYQIANMKNNTEKTALHIAAESYKDSDLASENYHNENYEQKQSYGAMQRGYMEVCKLLLTKGASVNEKDEDGNSCIHTAVEAANTGLLKIIVDCGANVNCINNSKETALHKAVLCNKRAQEKCELLIGPGADVRVKDKYNRTPLHLAAMNGNYSVCKLLIENGADIDALDSYGTVPLHLAVKSKYFGVLKCLLAKGADLNTKDRNGRTALHLALGHFTENVIMCTLLLQGSADVNARDNNGRTPLHLARNNSCTAIERILLDANADEYAQDREGQTPTYLTDSYNVFSGTEYHKYDLSVIVKNLLELFASTSLTDKGDSNQLHHISRGQNLPNVIKHHLTECKSAKICVDETSLIWPYQDSETFKTACFDELEAIKDMKVGHHYLLDVLLQYSDPRYLSNSALKKAIGSFRMLKFRIYRPIIHKTFLRAQERVALFEMVQHVLMIKVNGNEMPPETMREIFSYLRDCDLNNIIIAKEPLINATCDKCDWKY